MEKLIVVLYVNVGGQSRQQSVGYIKDLTEHLTDKFKGEDVIHFVLLTEGETRMECLNHKTICCGCKKDKVLTQDEIRDYSEKLKSLYNNDKSVDSDINKWI